MSGQEQLPIMIAWGDPRLTVEAVLDVHMLGVDLYRSAVVVEEQRHPETGEAVSLYGGQVAAQALMAAGRTVATDRQPHSIHANFLRAGDSTAPTLYRVRRDLEGRSFSARRVEATQDGQLILTLSASFQRDRPTDCDDVEQQEQAPQVDHPDGLTDSDPFRLASMHFRAAEQPYPQARWPTRFWAKPMASLSADPLLHCAAVVYLSDISSGILPAPDGRGPSASLDHAVWFHRPPDANDWLLSEYHPRVSGRGRGWYVGSMFDLQGRLVASLTQEALFR